MASRAAEETTARVNVIPDQVSDSNGREDDTDDDVSLASAADFSEAGHRDLRVGQHKGEKKAIEIFNVLRVTEKMARDLTRRPVTTRDG